MTIGTHSSVAKSAACRREAYSALMEALDKDSCRDLKTDLRTNANGNGKAAWLILERECAETVSSLDDGNKIREWWQLTMEKDVGINPDSIVTMNRLITAKNALLTTSFTGDECTEKFLQSVKRPATLATEAQSLLDAPAVHRPARFYAQGIAAAGGGPAVPGGWIRTAIVEHFDTLWRVKYAAGEDGLRFHAPTTASIRSGPSTRADGMSAEDLANAVHAVGLSGLARAMASARRSRSEP